MTDFSADTAGAYRHGLEQVARNFAFSWHPESRALFDRLDAELFQHVDRNPVEFVAQLPQETVDRAAGDEGLRADLERVLGAVLSGLDAPVRLHVDESLQVAYFSLEFG